MSNSQRISPFRTWNNQDEFSQEGAKLQAAQQEQAKHHYNSKDDIEGIENNHPGIFNSLKNFTNISRLLRVLGALAVVASMSAFLMQDWSGGSDLTRFYLMLAQTLLLATGGFGLSFLMKENKGGRVFFGLSLISVTVNFTVLGALIFSQFQWFGSIGEYPEFLTWATTSITALCIAGVSAFIAMVPIAWFSYKVFSRPFVKQLLLLFAVGNLLLLLPVRDSLMVGVIVLAAVMIPLWSLRKKIFNETSLKTPEGMFAVATVFVPALIMLVRSFWLYQVDELLLVMLGAIVFLMLRIFSMPLKDNSVIKFLLNMSSLVTAGFIAYNAGLASQGLIPDAYMLSVTGTMFAALTLEVSNRAGKFNLIFSILAVLGLLSSHFLLLLVIGGVASAVLLLLAGLVVVVIGHAEKSRGILITGLVSSLVGFGYQMYNTFLHIDFTNWATLAVIGVTGIVIASLLERHGLVLKHKWDKWSHFKSIKEA